MYFLYLHGFNSGPGTPKAQKIKRWLTETYSRLQFDEPQLSIEPATAIAQAETLLQAQNSTEYKFIIGSSLGGYYTSYLTEKYPTVSGAILINPVVDIEQLMRQLPEKHHHPFLHCDYTIAPEKKSDILKYKVNDYHTLKRYLLLLQDDDDICCTDTALKVFSQADIWLGSGQGHTFSDIETTFYTIKQFINRKIDANER